MANRTYWEILGVDKTATPEAIRSAFRFLARKHHPDVGGDAALFSEITEAYRVLINPGSRLLYAKTGKTERPEIETEIRDVLMSAFGSALKEDLKSEGRLMIKEYVIRFIKSGQDTVRGQIKDLHNRRRILKLKRNRIKTAEEENFWHILVDAELVAIDGHLDDGAHELELGDLALKFMEKYDEQSYAGLLTISDLLNSMSMVRRNNPTE